MVVAALTCAIVCSLQFSSEEELGDLTEVEKLLASIEH